MIETLQMTTNKLEETRQILILKRKAEGRPHYVHDLLDGFQDTDVGEVLVQAIVDGKDPINTIYTFFAAVRYYSNEDPTTWDKAKLENFTSRYRNLIETALKEKNLSKNLGQRALPVLSILAEARVDKPMSVVELGAGAGLIGMALLNSSKFIGSLEQYCMFSPAFASYIASHPIQKHTFDFRSYLGVDLHTVDKGWANACIEEPDVRAMSTKFAEDFSGTENVCLIQANALGFSNLPVVREVLDSGSQMPVIITSMIMYQLAPEVKDALQEEIALTLSSKSGLHVFMDYDAILNKFVGGLVNYGAKAGEVKPLIFSNGDCMEWEHE